MEKIERFINKLTFQVPNIIILYNPPPTYSSQVPHPLLPHPAHPHQPNEHPLASLTGTSSRGERGVEVVQITK